MKVNFSDQMQLAAVVLAKFGLGNKYISQRTGLRPGQINHRLRIAKKLERAYGKGIGYRTAWRQGLSPIQNHIFAIGSERVSHETHARLIKELANEQNRKAVRQGV